GPWGFPSGQPHQARMALALLFLAGTMADYAAKILLLVYLWHEPRLRLHFVALAAVHVLAGIRRAYAICQGTAQVSCCGAWPVVVLLLGVATPLLQVFHLVDALAAWWCHQDVGKRLPLRSAPLDVILEGLVFMVMALHLRLCLLLGRLEPLTNVAQCAFEECLLGTLAISLCTVAVALVLLDSTLSLKLSRDMWPPREQCVRSFMRDLSVSEFFAFDMDLRRGEEADWLQAGPGLAASVSVMRDSDQTLPFLDRTGCRSCWVFAAQLAYRLVEVAAKLSVVAVTATVLQPSYFAGSEPLLFANLSQFVDCPKHYAAAQHAASLVCGLRALEIAVAVSLVAAAFLLEVEVLDPSGTATGWLADVQTASIVRTWQALCHRTSAAVWGACLLAHYICMCVSWCGSNPQTPDAPLLPEQQRKLSVDAASAAATA
ncbi:unnamed protein product, partial [Polarella glacialis]